MRFVFSKNLYRISDNKEGTSIHSYGHFLLLSPTLNDSPLNSGSVEMVLGVRD